MITRLPLLGAKNESVPAAGNEQFGASRRRRYLGGWLLLSALTAAFLVWLGYRWLAQPTWPESLPGFLAEALTLAQMAAGVTLLFLWIGLVWRHHRKRRTRRELILGLNQLQNLSPKQFEQYVAALYRAKGYKVKLRGGTGDHGVDLELFGPNGKRAVVQCKRYHNTVGEDVVRDLYGTLLHERASRAFLVTSAEISEPARSWAEGKPITLIDGETLVRVAAAIRTSQDRS